MTAGRKQRPAIAAGAYSPAERARLFGGKPTGPAWEGREPRRDGGKLTWATGEPGLLRAEEAGSAEAVPGERGELIDFVSVEDRLVEAFRTLAALPDPAPGPRLRMMALWRDVVPDRVDIDQEPTPGRPGVSRADMRRMDEALGWCEWLTPEARRIVGAAIVWQAQGRGELRWADIRRQLGVTTTTDTLRMAYSRALSRICGRLNRCR